ncbi:MAG: DNA translocase FtsK 4TM domain-containing protein [Pseudomonadales bacterium]|nr:DNA translocase FtsK 4TM domain-containing protein [Pseudomonadales bacterium]MBO6595239.1 DNA translocase FtsK 4TM domain-containing protein [Pseudomonadales bacterium]MBO6821202.1 DNA translocase FtsK 4TM domain-containing protein [Pseudomonadales bacterium]
MTVAQSKTSSKTAPRQAPSDFSQQVAPRLKEGAFIALVAIALYLVLALISFDKQDPGWTYTGANDAVNNIVGRSGAWVADVFLFFFGFLAFIFPMMLAWQAWVIFRERQSADEFSWPIFIFKGVGLFLTICAGTGLAAMHFFTFGLDYQYGSGGIVGREIADLLVPVFSYVGTTLILLAMFLFGLTAFLDISWLKVMDTTGHLAIEFAAMVQAYSNRVITSFKERAEIRKSAEHRREALEKHVERKQQRPAPVIEAPPPPKKEESKRVARERQGNLFKISAVDGLPALHLLDEQERDHSKGYSAEDLEAMSRLLELKLKDYGVEAEVVAVFPGPVITRFEIQPAPGVKVSRISGLAKDLARSLAVISVRVVEVIPGKSVVGIEIPNVDREIVQMSDVLKSKAYDDSQSPLSLALGHDIAGEPVVEDLAKMPHLLVAGTTGSGKSVGLNAMILSVLFKASPEDVRLIMVDPKMLELAVYEGIPHLLTPVVTDMKDAANALRWCVAEMERRYRLMAAMGVRNVGGFNRKVKDAKKAGEPLLDPLWQPDPLLDEEDQQAPELETLPFIVVIIDEFADMMMIVGKKVEELIARIAQKARAAGIHLILATQRPSVDVITGLIKANVPTRIAFQVSSKVDSRTILDQGGAEQLLGHGDMLYLPAGKPLPIRVHGAFVDDDEVHRVVESWKELGEPNYLDSILEGASENDMLPGAAGAAGSADSDEDADPLYDEAVAFVTESRRASISAVQRKLRIGYNRAARMIETMEAAGVVSEMNSNGSREVLANAPPE